VHPDYIVDYEKRLVYEALVQYLSQLRATKELWFALPGEVDTWWRERSRMALVNNGGYWRIVGEGSERAMLAYAKNIDGKLAYEFPSGPGSGSSNLICLDALVHVELGISTCGVARLLLC
jgi:hypothetical protein